MDYDGLVPRRFKLYVFDLDGTLVDSLEDLYLSVNWILCRRGYAPVDRECVRRAVGNGARNLLSRAFLSSAALPESGGKAVPPDSAMGEILAEYRAHYDARCADHTVLYPGIREWIESLAAGGFPTAVLTNKPESATRALLRALGVDSLFSVIAGPETFGALKPDPAGLRAIMAATGCSPGETLMIGDSPVDVETARNAGAASCGITGGLGDETSLIASKPDILIERKKR